MFDFITTGTLNCAKIVSPVPLILFFLNSILLAWRPGYCTLYCPGLLRRVHLQRTRPQKEVQCTMVKKFIHVLRKQERKIKILGNSRALVTGGSSGIGAALVRKLASQKLNVVVVALDDRLMAEFKKTIVAEFPEQSFRFVGCDLSSPIGDGYLKAIQEATRDIDVQILCNNAGFITTGCFADTPAARSMANYHTNVTAPLILTHHFLNRMLNKGLRGLVTFTSSSAGFIPNPMGALYGKPTIRKLWPVTIFNVLLSKLLPRTFWLHLPLPLLQNMQKMGLTYWLW